MVPTGLTFAISLSCMSLSDYDHIYLNYVKSYVKVPIMYVVSLFSVLEFGLLHLVLFNVM